MLTDPLPIRLDTPLDPRKVCVRATTCDLKSCVKPMLNYQPFRPLLQWSISWWLRNWVKKDGCIVWCSSCWASKWGATLSHQPLYVTMLSQCFKASAQLVLNKLEWMKLVGRWAEVCLATSSVYIYIYYIYTSCRWFLFSLIIQESYAVELIRCNGKDIHAYTEYIYIYIHI